MRLIGLRRGTSRDLSSIGNHLKEIGVIAVTPPLRMSIGSEVLARSPKSAAIRRECSRNSIPRAPQLRAKWGNVPDTEVHVRTMCSKNILLGPLDVARRNQSNRMPNLHQLASPAMGRRARLHTNKTRGKPPEDPISAGGEVAERAKSCPDRTPNEITKEGAYDE